MISFHGLEKTEETTALRTYKGVGVELGLAAGVAEGRASGVTVGMGEGLGLKSAVGIIAGTKEAFVSPGT